MERQILLTADGSITIQLPEGETYHSKHGAIQESKHVYIEAGLDYHARLNNAATFVKVFETGMGTGLNVLLTALYAREHNKQIQYHTVEPYPLTEAEMAAINYGTLLNSNELLQRIYAAAWDSLTEVSPGLQLMKCHQALQAYSSPLRFHVIYHDAFAPGIQPGLWTEGVFAQLFEMLEPGGVLVTYCSKVSVQQAMRSAGFTIEKIEGPRGKREMIRALKG